MRRIYESNALKRDDDDPFQPNASDATTTPQAMRTVPGKTLSRHLVPHWVRHRSISLDISTPQSVYEMGTSIPFAITMNNAMPFPIALPMRSPLLWTWSVDGVREASHVAPNPPARTTEFVFDRGERKRFVRHWNQLFRTAEDEWAPAPRGEYTISAELNVDDAARKGMRAETTVELIQPDG